MATVTISRQLGSGGDLIGQAVARELRAPYLDKEIVRLAAERLGIAAELSPGDDEEQVLKKRLLGAILLYDPEVAGADEPATTETPRLVGVTDAQFRQVMEEVMREAAARGNAVIVGRGGQILLRSQPHVLHVHIHAPQQQRVHNLMEQYGLSAADAQQLIAESDRERTEYVQSVYHVDWQAPDLYDLTINMRHLPVQTAVTLIVSAARALEPVTPAQPSALYQRLRQEEYTPREAADLLLISPDVIRHAVFSGELPASRAGQHIISITRQNLLAWLEKQLAIQ